MRMEGDHNNILNIDQHEKVPCSQLVSLVFNLQPCLYAECLIVGCSCAGDLCQVGSSGSYIWFASETAILFVIHDRRNAMCVAFLLSLVFQLLAISISCCIWYTWIRIWRNTIFEQTTCIIQSMMAYAHAILK